MSLWKGLCGKAAPPERPEGFSLEYFPSAREGLFCYLQSLAKQYPLKTEVIVSAYICEAIPEAIRNAGLRPRFVDLAPNSILNIQEGLREALSAKTLAIILAPYFGLYSEKYLKLEAVAGEVALVLDFAQGVGLPYEDLGMDAVLLSFGIGKGVDFWGGALVSKPSAAAQSTKGKAKGCLASLISSVRVCLQLVLLRRAAIFAFFGNFIDRRSAKAKGMKRLDHVLRLRGGTVRRIGRRRQVFLQTLPIARARAKKLFENPKVRNIFPDFDSVDAEKSTFLRFPLLMPDASSAEDIMAFFLKRSIELTKAGERRQGEQFLNTNSIAERLVKMPYLGALRECEFERLRKALDNFLKQRPEIGTSPTKSSPN